MKGMNNLRVEKHIIKSVNPYLDTLMDFCHKSKNLYNHANYIIRQEFISNGKWIKYNELDKILKADTEYNDYIEMPTAQSAQQILRLIDKNWKSFFKSIKDWSEHKEKYLGRPKLPKYLKKNGKYLGESYLVIRYDSGEKTFNYPSMAYDAAKKEWVQERTVKAAQFHQCTCIYGMLRWR